MRVTTRSGDVVTYVQLQWAILGWCCAMAVAAFLVGMIKSEPCYEARSERDEYSAEVTRLRNAYSSITDTLLVEARHSREFMGVIADSVASYQARGRGIYLVRRGRE